MKEITFYKTKDNETQIEVTIENETVWLTQQQMAELFQQTKQNVSRHINNCFKEKELYQNVVVKESLTAASDGKVYNIKYYNLDVIVSVGYRIKSNRGTQFRQWATARLREYLVEGLALNEKRLEQKNKQIRVLHDGIRILSRVIEEKTNTTGSFNWLSEFKMGLQLLDDFDNETLDKIGKNSQKANYPTIAEYLRLVNRMKSTIKSQFFGRVKDKGFESAINQVEQAIGRNEVYPTIEEKAAMLLYLIVKNHAFIDGNKRIAAACFLLFLERNNILYNREGKPIISNEALAGLTLFVASSNPDEIETIKMLLVSILNRNLAE
jgi:prophage maintenance system killer protein